MAQSAKRPENTAYVSPDAVCALARASQFFSRPPPREVGPNAPRHTGFGRGAGALAQGRKGWCAPSAQPQPRSGCSLGRHNKKGPARASGGGRLRAGQRDARWAMAGRQARHSRNRAWSGMFRLAMTRKKNRGKKGNPTPGARVGRARTWGAIKRNTIKHNRLFPSNKRPPAPTAGLRVARSVSCSQRCRLGDDDLLTVDC